MIGYHTLRNCCSTTSNQLLSTNHFLRVYFFSIDPQNSFDGSTNSPGYSVICKNPELFKFWADFQIPSNLPSFPSKLPSFPLSLYWTNSVFTVISYALASDSRILSNHRSPHNMSFFGLGSKNKVPTIPPLSPFPIRKGLTYGAAQLLATPKTSSENDYVKFGT